MVMMMMIMDGDHACGGDAGNGCAIEDDLRYDAKVGERW